MSGKCQDCIRDLTGNSMDLPGSHQGSINVIHSCQRPTRDLLGSTKVLPGTYQRPVLIAALACTIAHLTWLGRL